MVPQLAVVFAGIFERAGAILPFRLAASQPFAYIARLQTAAVAWEAGG